MTAARKRKPRMTGWFPPEIKPVRKGWYDCARCSVRHWWNGREWKYYPSDDISWPMDRDDRWRGLASKP